MKKAIVAVPYLSGKGGTETVIKNFYEAVVNDSKNSDFTWKLISYGGSKYSAWINPWDKKVYSFTNNRIFQMLAYILLLPFLIPANLKKEKPDFFIATNPIIWSIAYKAKKYCCPNTKVIAWYHFSFDRKKVKNKYLYNVDSFWVISSGIKQELINRGISENKIFVIYNPIQLGNVNQVLRSGKQNRFIYIGRIDYDEQKNVSELINALGFVKGEWQCDLYGSVDEETKLRLLQLADSYKIRDRIKFHGFSEDVWSTIKIADCLILTSKFEGLPMVLCEAAARGVALISANCPTGPDDIVNRNNGYLYQSGNVTELSHLISQVVNGKSILPPKELVISSVAKFNYNKYKARVYKSLIGKE